VIIPIQPPFDFRKTARAAGYYFALGKASADHAVYRKLIRIGKGVALVELSDASESPHHPAVRAEVLAHRGNVSESHLIDTLTHMVNPQAQRQTFYDYAASIPALNTTVEYLYGLHTLRAESLFDALILTVIEQQIALKAAQQAERWFAAWGGESICYGGETFYTLPAPERIAAATVDDLIPLKITFIRMRVLMALANLALNGGINFDQLRCAPADEVYTTLIGLKGVGHWTAAWAMIRALGHYVYLGSADVALRAAVNHYFYGLPGRADRNVTDSTFASFGEYAGTAAYHIIMRWALEKY